jgi:hypothetical protein
MWTSDFHAKTTSPGVNTAGGDGDLISSALVIFCIEPAGVNVREDGAFRHARTACDLRWLKVLLDCRERKDDVDQLGARPPSKRAMNFFSSLSQQIHAVRQLLLPPAVTREDNRVTS